MYTHTNNNMAANTQNKAFNGVRQGKWLRKLVADTLLWDLGFYVGFVLPRQVFALAANNDFLDQQSKETFFFLFKKSKTDSGKLRFTMNGCIFSFLSKYVEQTFTSMKVEEKIFLNLLCIYINSFRKEARATCIPQHCVLRNKHQ